MLSIDTFRSARFDGAEIGGTNFSLNFWLYLDTPNLEGVLMFLKKQCYFQRHFLTSKNTLQTDPQKSPATARATKYTRPTDIANAHPVSVPSFAFHNYQAHIIAEPGPPYRAWPL